MEMFEDTLEPLQNVVLIVAMLVRSKAFFVFITVYDVLLKSALKANLGQDMKHFEILHLFHMECQVP